MDRNTPTSPGPSHRAEPLKSEPIPSGFQELIQHNNNTNNSLHPPPPQPHHHTQGSAGMDSITVRSQPGSRYGTPVPTHGHDYNNHAGSGQLQVYHQSMYSHESSPYGPVPETHHPYSTPATSPPTPSRASELRQMRSGAVIHKTTQYSKALAPMRAAVEKSTPSNKKGSKPKKGNKNTAALNDITGIEGPLSELTKDSEIELIDIEAFIMRPVEERLRETEEGKNPGHIKRPMNAFMLYRKAYQGRAKEYMKQLNHQVVSTVCGTSWKRETQAFRDQYKAWADIERANHKEAFPDYKFAPAKNNKPKPKAIGGGGDRADSEDMDVLDPDWHRAPGHGSEYTPPRSLYGMPSYAYGGGNSNNRSAFEYTNPGKQLPAPYDHRGDLGSSSYYEMQVHQRQARMHHPGVVEDVMLHKTPSPFAQGRGGNMHPQHYGLPAYSTHSPGMEPQHPPPYSRHSPGNIEAQQQLSSYSRHSPGMEPPPPPQRFEHRIDPSLQDGGMYDAGSLFFESAGGNMAAAAAAQQTWSSTMHLAGNQDNEGHFNASILSGGGVGGGGLDETLSAEQQTQFLRGAQDWEIEPLGDSAFDGSWETK